jgi:hypothetical protein
MNWGTCEAHFAGAPQLMKMEGRKIWQKSRKESGAFHIAFVTRTQAHQNENTMGRL